MLKKVNENTTTEEKILIKNRKNGTAISRKPNFISPREITITDNTIGKKIYRNFVS